MASHIYNVKQAAKILGLSTNTTYKYLNEGRIKAARGHIRGTFIITHKSLETFLGTKLPDDPLKDLDPDNLIPSLAESHETILEITPPNLPTRILRFLIIISLVLIIIDIILSSNTTAYTHLTRLAFVSIVILVAYQHGGFIKK